MKPSLISLLIASAVLFWLAFGVRVLLGKCDAVAQWFLDAPEHRMRLAVFGWLAVFWWMVVLTVVEVSK